MSTTSMQFGDAESPERNGNLATYNEPESIAVLNRIDRIWWFVLFAHPSAEIFNTRPRIGLFVELSNTIKSESLVFHQVWVLSILDARIGNLKIGLRISSEIDASARGNDRLILTGYDPALVRLSTKLRYCVTLNGKYFCFELRRLMMPICDRLIFRDLEWIHENGNTKCVLCPPQFKENKCLWL